MTTEYLAPWKARHKVLKQRNDLLVSQLKNIGEAAFQLNIAAAIERQQEQPDAPLIVQIAGGYDQPVANAQTSTFTRCIFNVGRDRMPRDFTVPAVPEALYRRMADALLTHIVTPMAAEGLNLIPVTVNLKMGSSPASHALALIPAGTPSLPDKIDMAPGAPNLISIEDTPMLSDTFKPYLLKARTTHVTKVILPDGFNDMVRKNRQGSQGVTLTYETLYNFDQRYTRTHIIDTHSEGRRISEPTPPDAARSPIGRIAGNRPGSRLKVARL